MTTIILLLLSFLIGSIPTGYLLGRMYGVDLRKQGSGNIGATNALRVLGKKVGLLTFIGDILKGAIAVCLPAAVSTVLKDAVSSDFAPFCGAAAVIGHCYSPFLNFKGGKGVATAFGAFLTMAPLPALLALGLFAGLYKLFGFVSVGSIGAAVFLPAAIFFEPLIRPAPGSNLCAAAAAIIAVIVVIRHKDNIARLIQGTELKTAKSSPGKANGNPV